MPRPVGFVGCEGASRGLGSLEAGDGLHGRNFRYVNVRFRGLKAERAIDPLTLVMRPFIM